MSAEENRQLIHSVLAGEVNLLDHLAEDAIVTVHGFKSVEGKQEIARFLGSVEALFSSGRQIPTSVAAEGDHVFVETHDVGQVTKKGDDYNNRYCLVYKFRDGKIVHFTEYTDTALARAVLPELDWPEVNSKHPAH